MQSTTRVTELAFPETGDRGQAGPVLTFRDFRLYPCARLLLRGDEPVTLGGRAFDLLHALLADRGRLVGKLDLLARVWPNTFVDESNLRFQVASLRKALGRDGELLKTIPGRGYMLAEEVGLSARPEQPAHGAAVGPAGGLTDGAHDVPGAVRILVLLLLQELGQLPAGSGGALPSSEW